MLFRSRCLLAALARRLLRSRALGLARGLSCRPGCGPACSTSTHLLDEEFLGLPALPDQFGQPAGLQTAARPGLLGVGGVAVFRCDLTQRSEEHTSELQSLMRISYAVFCLKKK